jgi:hypothetical protein
MGSKSSGLKPTDDNQTDHKPLIEDLQIHYARTDVSQTFSKLKRFNYP